MIYILSRVHLWGMQLFMSSRYNPGQNLTQPFYFLVNYLNSVLSNPFYSLGYTFRKQVKIDHLIPALQRHIEV